MPDWETLFGTTTLVQAVLWIAAVALLIGVVVKLWPFIRNAVAIVDALVKLPDLAKQVAEIHHETHTNDGSSIKDGVGRIEASLEGLHGRTDELERNVASLAKADIEIRDQIDHTQPKE